MQKPILVLALMAAALASTAAAQSTSVRITGWGDSSGASAAAPIPPPSPPPGAFPYPIVSGSPYGTVSRGRVRLHRIALEGYFFPVNRPAMRLGDSGKTLEFAGLPRAGSGAEEKWAEIASIPVRHAMTGVLRQEVRSGGGPLVRKRSTPAGTPVYGVAAARLDGKRAQTVWCAPIGDRADGETNCFPTDEEKVVRYVRLEGADLLSTFMPMNERPGATPVEVEPRDVPALAPMRMGYYFNGWTAGHAKIGVVVSWEGGRAFLGTFEALRRPDGSVEMAALGGDFRLRPGVADPKAAIVETLRAPSSTPLVWPFEN